jgi:hypothetical protein
VNRVLSMEEIGQMGQVAAIAANMPVSS